jgi:hypothetical protein
MNIHTTGRADLSWLSSLRYSRFRPLLTQFLRDTSLKFGFYVVDGGIDVSVEDFRGHILDIVR